MTLFLALTAASILTFALPYTSPSVYPWLLLDKILLSLAITAPAANPLYGDYIQREHVAKGTALTGLGVVVGEVVSMGGLLQITKHMSYRMAFLLCAACAEVIAIALLFLVKEPKLREREVEYAEDTHALDEVTSAPSPAPESTEQRNPIHSYRIN